MRYYSNTSRDMTLTVGIDTSVIAVVVNDASGLPIQFPFNIAVDAGLSTVEIMEVTGVAANTLTVIRGRQDTSAKAHTVGAVIYHSWTALEGQELQGHLAATQNVHGIGSGASVVGTITTQTLTNKTIAAGSNTITGLGDANISSISGSKITGAITVGTIAVGNVTGSWPIDSRSTGSIPIDTRTTGNLPIDTRSTGSLDLGSRTTGSLAGSRVTSPVNGLTSDQFTDTHNSVDLSNPPWLNLRRLSKSIPNGSSTQIDTWTVRENIGFPVPAGDGTITFPAYAARWRVTLYINWPSGPTGNHAIFHNISGYPDSLVKSADTGNDTSHSVSFTFRATASQTMVMQAYQFTGGAQTLNAAVAEIEYAGR